MDFLESLLHSIDGKCDGICQYKYDSQWSCYITFIQRFAEKLLYQRSNEEVNKLKKNFMSAKTHTDRMRLMQNDPYFSASIDSMYNQIVENATRSEPKNETKAIEYLQKGLQLVEQSNYSEAVEYFSKAIENATISSILFCECLKRRGYCLYNSKYFKDAYKDFTEALQTNLSQQDVPWLLLMKGKCLMKMGENDEARKVLFDAEQTILSSNDLTEDAKSRMIDELYATETTLQEAKDKHVDIPLLTENTKIPGFTSSLQMCTNKEKGRHVIVKKNIKKGTIILSEDAIGFWLAPCRYETCCNLCMKMLGNRYVSCRECKAVRYCSLFCENKAWTEYHSVECAYLDFLKYFSSYALSLRLVIRYGFNAILKTIDDGEKSLEYFCKNGMADNYTFVYSLFLFDSHLPFEPLFAYCVGSLIVTRLAEVMGLIKRDSNEYCTFAAVIFKHVLQININCYSLINQELHYLPDLNIFADHGDNTKNGIGVYIGGSLFSHSCDHNCDRHTVGKQLVVVTNRNLKAGEEITITYGPSYKTMSLNERQEYLKDHYHFECKCNACVNKWENMTYAYRCTQCSGALVYNPGTTAYCIHCGANFRDISVFTEKTLQAKEYVVQAKMSLKSMNLKVVKKNLDNALMITKRIHFSVVPQYGIRKYLLEYFCFKRDYFQMHVQCLHLAFIEQEIHGNDALEAAAFMITAAYLLLRHINSTGKESGKSKLSTVFAVYREALVILNEIRDRKMNVVLKDYARRFKLIPVLNRMLQN